MAAERMRLKSSLMKRPFCPACRHVLPMLHGGAQDSARRGAAAAVAAWVRQLSVRLVPYMLLLAVPLLGRMSDPDPAGQTQVLGPHPTWLCSDGCPCPSRPVWPTCAADGDTCPLHQAKGVRPQLEVYLAVHVASL